jgi:hypothetical protein
MVEPSVIREMLDELRFDEAEDLVGMSGRDTDPELLTEIARRRDEAEESAAELARRVIDLGENQRLGEIVELAQEPAVRPLLSLVPDTSRQRAELYMREAERWASRRAEINARRLGEARRALEGLDLELARGLIRRIDTRFLSDEQEADRDRLFLDVAARAMEMESLAETGRRLAGQNEVQQRSRRRRRWWRLWSG